MEHTDAIPNGALCETGRWLDGWWLPWSGMAWPGRWSRYVGTARSLCDGEANDGKRLNDDYRQRINHNYHYSMLTKDPQMFAEGFGGPIRVVYAQNYVPQ